jgi:hypothetical protein
MKTDAPSSSDSEWSLPTWGFPPARSLVERLTPEQKEWLLQRTYPVEDPLVLQHETLRWVWRALVELHAQGFERVGPSRIAQWVEEQCGKRFQTTFVTHQLLKLVARGWVERLPLGPRRALYRAVEFWGTPPGCKDAWNVTPPRAKKRKGTP